MRKVSASKLWKTARPHLKESEYALRGGVFGTRPYIWEIDELFDIVKREYSPVLRKVLRLNGCRNGSAITRISHTLVWNVIRETFDGHLDWIRWGWTPLSVRKEYKRRINRINHMLAHQGRCHVTFKGLVCYCDEQAS